MLFKVFLPPLNLICLLGLIALPVTSTISLASSPGLAQSQTQPKNMEVEKLLKQGLEEAKLRKFELAIQSLKQAIQFARQAGNRESTILVLKHLNEILGSFEELNPDKAQEQRQQILERLSIDETKVFQGWNGLFNLNFTGWQLLMDLGDDYVKSGNYIAAIEMYRKALVAAGTPVERNGMPPFILPKQEKGLLMAQARASTKLGWVFGKLGNLPDAEKILRESGDKWNNLWRMTQREDHKQQLDVLLKSDAERLKIFDIGEQQALSNNYLQSILVKRGQQNQALEASEQVRTIALVDELGSQLSDYSERELGTKAVVLKELQRTAKLQNSTIIEYSIVYENIVDNNQYRDDDVSAFSSGASTARQFINIQELSLENLLPKPTKLFIWIIQPNEKVSFREVDLGLAQKSLAQMLIDNRQSIGVRSRNSSISLEPIDTAQQLNQLNQQLNQLHKLLIQPISDLLPNNVNERIIFVPNRILTLIPFAALRDDNGQYLVEKHTISVAPSIRSLSLTKQLSQRVHKRQRELDGFTKAALVVGNPTMPEFTSATGEKPKQLPSLPGAEQEAKAVANLFKVSALIGDQATVAKVQREFQAARIIHLATHGILEVFSEDGPGAIALAPFENNSGFLTTSAILNMPEMPADLVVLSACDTARGQITGEGVIGLSRAFIIAGVPSVIVSLWSVPDAPTAELMVDFYRNWREKKMDKAQALRQAMLTTMKTHPNPRDWAAFTLIGEAE
jgi:CHAT domain-containing protein